MPTRSPRPAPPGGTAAPRNEVAALVRAALADHGSVTWHARGRSMAPAIRDGQRLDLRPVDGEVAPGDVVLAALADGRLVVHRVHRASGTEVVLWGDRNRRPDSPVGPAAVIARVDPTPAPGLVTRIHHRVVRR